MHLILAIDKIVYIFSVLFYIHTCIYCIHFCHNKLHNVSLEIFFRCIKVWSKSWSTKSTKSSETGSESSGGYSRSLLSAWRRAGEFSGREAIHTSEDGSWGTVLLYPTFLLLCPLQPVPLIHPCIILHNKLAGQALQESLVDLADMENVFFKRISECHQERPR